MKLNRTKIGSAVVAALAAAAAFAIIGCGYGAAGITPPPPPPAEGQVETPMNFAAGNIIGLATAGNPTITMLSRAGNFEGIRFHGRTNNWDGLDIVFRTREVNDNTAVGLINDGVLSNTGTYTIRVEGSGGAPVAGQVWTQRIPDFGQSQGTPLVANADFDFERDITMAPAWEAARIATDEAGATSIFILTNVVIENAAGNEVWSLVDAIAHLVPGAPEEEYVETTINLLPGRVLAFAHGMGAAVEYTLVTYRGRFEELRVTGRAADNNSPILHLWGNSEAVDLVHAGIVSTGDVVTVRVIGRGDDTAAGGFDIRQNWATRDSVPIVAGEEFEAYWTVTIGDGAGNIRLMTDDTAAVEPNLIFKSVQVIRGSDPEGEDLLWCLSRVLMDPAGGIPGGPDPSQITVRAHGGATTMLRGFTLGFDAFAGFAPAVVSWSTSHGTIDANGVLSVPETVAAGTEVTVTASSRLAPLFSGTATVTVGAVQVTIDPTFGVLNPNDTQQFTATIVPANAPSGTPWAVNWVVTGDNLGGSTISATGMLTVGAAAERVLDVRVSVGSLTQAYATALVVVDGPPVLLADPDSDIVLVQGEPLNIDMRGFNFTTLYGQTVYFDNAAAVTLGGTLAALIASDEIEVSGSIVFNEHGISTDGTLTLTFVGFDDESTDVDDTGWNLTVDFVGVIGATETIGVSEIIPLGVVYDLASVIAGPPPITTFGGLGPGLIADGVTATIEGGAINVVRAEMADWRSLRLVHAALPMDLARFSYTIQVVGSKPPAAGGEMRIQMNGGAHSVAATPGTDPTAANFDFTGVLTADFATQPQIRITHSLPAAVTFEIENIVITRTGVWPQP